MLRLHVPIGATPAVGQRLPLLQVGLAGQTLEGEPIRLGHARLSPPVLPPHEWAALPQDELVSRRAGELAAAGALTRLRRAAEHHDWNEVDRQLDDALQRFADNAWVASGVAVGRHLNGAGPVESPLHTPPAPAPTIPG